MLFPSSLKSSILFTVWCLTLLSFQTVHANRYTIPDSTFLANGWAKPLDGTITSDTDFDYNSSTYESNFGMPQMPD